MRLRAIGLLGAFLATGCAYAQTDARGLEKELKGKQLVLRSYSAERVGRYWWEHGVLVHAAPSVRTLGIFVPSSVKENGQKLTISGSRSTVIRDTKNSKLGLAGKSDMKIEVDLTGADAASLLAKLRDLLFFPDTASAFAGIPGNLARFIPATVPGPIPPDPCDCERFLRDGEWAEIAKDDKGLKDPRLTYKEDPSFTDEARVAKVNGSVRFTMFVDDKGRVSDLWLAVPLGYGLDDAAETAVKSYRFDPARYDNQPVGIELQVEVSFQIF